MSMPKFRPRPIQSDLTWETLRDLKRRSAALRPQIEITCDEKAALRAAFTRLNKSLVNPRLHLVAAVLALPLLQRLVIPALGLDDFAVVRVFVDFYDASTTNSFLRSRSCTFAATSLWIKDIESPRARIGFCCNASRIVGCRA